MSVNPAETNQLTECYRICSWWRHIYSSRYLIISQLDDSALCRDGDTPSSDDV